MDYLTISIIVSVAASVGLAVFIYLFKIEKDESERLTLENQELREMVRKKDDELRDMGVKLGCSQNDARLGELKNKWMSKQIEDFKKRGCIRNKYGVWQNYADLLDNGDRKPRTRAQKIKDMGDHFLSEVEKIKEMKPHQLKFWHTVPNATQEQIDLAFDEAKKHGIEVYEEERCNGGRLLVFTDSVGVCESGCDQDINIPFDEFMARIRGEWVEQKPKA